MKSEKHRNRAQTRQTEKKKFQYGDRGRTWRENTSARTARN